MSTMNTLPLLLPGVASRSSFSPLSSSVAEPSCNRDIVGWNSKGGAFLRGRGRRWATFLDSQFVSTQSSSRTMTTTTTMRVEARLGSHSVASSLSKDDSALPQQDAETGLCNGVLISNIGASLVATAFIAANAVAFEASAAVGQSTAGSDDNSNFMFVVICVGEAIALTGAAVGGILARQRKVELEKINAQLRQINVNLRRQSRLETYAPNLTYAPVGSGRMQDLQVRSDPVRDELMQFLKAGKRWLREQKPVNAYGEFQKALPLAQQLKDTAEEKKAARGLGASCHRQGKYKEAIKYHSLVLDISKRTRENSGDTEAYGAIADCYTELGDLETAGKFYDLYIDRLETDDTL